jgi:hypothetical protein
MKVSEYTSYNCKSNVNFKGLNSSAIEKLGGIGFSDINVKLHGFCGKGATSLEVVDKTNIFNTSIDFSNGGDIVLTSNYMSETPIILTNDTNIELNGKKITGPIFSESNGEVMEGDTDSYGIWVKNGNITIDGEGEIIAQDAKYSMAVWANGGNVVIKNGKFYNGGDSCDLIYASNGGNVIIEGGEFFPKGPASGEEEGTKNAYSALNVKDADFKKGISNIIVKGGIFHNFNPAINVSEGENTNFVADGYKSVEVEPNTNVWEVIPE